MVASIGGSMILSVVALVVLIQIPTLAASLSGGLSLGVLHEARSASRIAGGSAQVTKSGFSTIGKISKLFGK